MKRNDQTFQEMVSRINSGELTRKQAADAYGIKYGTLMVWLGRSGLNAETSFRTPSKNRVTHGAAAAWPALTPERIAALDAAVARVVAGKSTALGESKADPQIKLSTITQRVRSAKKALPVAPKPVTVTPTDDTSNYDLLVGVLSDPSRLAKVAAVVRAAGL